MRPPAFLVAFAAAVLAGACGAGARETGLPPVAGAERGRQVVAQNGCLACHRIGGTGNAGPGPQLDEVGQRLPASAIRRLLVNPTPPMPSYRELPPDDLAALTRYLAGLR